MMTRAMKTKIVTSFVSFVIVSLDQLDWIIDIHASELRLK